MTAISNSFIKQALDLNPGDRIKLVEQLLESLDKPDAEIDALWAREADVRIEAFERGEIEAVSAEQVFQKYKN